VNDGSENRAVELLEFVSLVVCPDGVTFGNVETTLGVRQLLYKANESLVISVLVLREWYEI